MAEQTAISWAHSTFNPWIGCTRISVAATGGGGCDHCYAEALDVQRFSKTLGGGTKRVPVSHWGAGARRHRTSEDTWKNPLRWNQLAAESGKVWRVFCASLADVFDNEVPPSWRHELGELVSRTPHLTWMFLTKRIGNLNAALRDFNWTRFPDNAWLGITVVNQAEAERDIPKLLRAPARVLWLSCEPLLGPIDLKRWLRRSVSSIDYAQRVGYDAPPGTKDRLDWVIVGGESGAGARAMDPTWARAIRDDCAAAGVPFHFKQWGEWAPGREGQERIGKRKSGHLLDGAEHRAFPGPR